MDIPTADRNLLRLISVCVLWQICSSASVSKPSNPGRSHDFSPRIVGGRREMDPSVVMWQALFLEEGSVVCGGSVISHNKVLTAAHCDIREESNSFAVRIGGETNRDGKKYPITKTYRHANFSRGRWNNPINDLMIVEFFNQDEKLGIWAPRLNNITNYPNDHTTLTTTGYGRLGINESLPGHLRSVNVPVVPHKQCMLSYPDVESEENICAGNEMFDSCKGDSGGPLWTRSPTNSSDTVLVGIVSYGYGCAAPNAPGVYSRVSGYVEWIEAVKALPETEYVAPKLPLWKIIVTVSVAATASIVLAVIVVLCILRRNRKKQAQLGADES